MRQMIGGWLGASLDGAALLALRSQFMRSGPGKAGSHRRAALDEAIAHYESAEVRKRFFPDAAPIAPDAHSCGRLSDGGETLDVSWDSAFVPSWDRVREDHLRWPANRVAHARLLLHPTPSRTLIVCLHGYLGGDRFVDRQAFALPWLYGLGADVALFTLPFHGARADARVPSWPSPNPARTNEGFAQAIFDLRSLRAWLRARPGAEGQRLAVLGMSLGAYTTALWATVDEVDFLTAIIPVADWPCLLWSHGEQRRERGDAERDGITLDVYQRAMSIVAPLSRSPRIAHGASIVCSALDDRIAPPEQARRLAAHLGADHLVLPGGHVLQLERRRMFAAIAQKMATLGLIEAR